MVTAVALAVRTLTRSLSEGARNITEAVGGMWSGLNQPEPTFVPLDELISKKFLEDLESGAPIYDDLVLEDASTTPFSADG